MVVVDDLSNWLYDDLFMRTLWDKLSNLVKKHLKSLYIYPKLNSKLCQF